MQRKRHKSKSVDEMYYLFTVAYQAWDEIPQIVGCNSFCIYASIQCESFININMILDSHESRPWHMTREIMKKKQIVRVCFSIQFAATCVTKQIQWSLTAEIREICWRMSLQSLPNGFSNILSIQRITIPDRKGEKIENWRQNVIKR